MIKIVMLCLFILGTNFSYGQTEINNLKAIAKTNVAGIAFQKKYSKKLRTQLKRNKESLNSVKKELDHWDEVLSTVGDDAQLANIELQNALQQQQQMLQTMSNVSKMLHDTAMAIIRKIG